MSPAITSEDVKSIAIAIGGVFFLYKFALGYLMTNLSLTSSTRRAAAGDGIDLVIVSTKVTKGDRECVQMKALTHTVKGEHTFVTDRIIEFENSSAPAGMLRLSPGEESTFEVAFSVASTTTVSIDISLTGWAGPISRRIPGYWRALLVSTPGDRRITKSDG